MKYQYSIEHMLYILNDMKDLSSPPWLPNDGCFTDSYKKDLVNWRIGEIASSDNPGTQKPAPTQGWRVGNTGDFREGNKKPMFDKKHHSLDNEGVDSNQRNKELESTKDAEVLRSDNEKVSAEVTVSGLPFTASESKDCDEKQMKSSEPLKRVDEPDYKEEAKDKFRNEFDENIIFVSQSNIVIEDQISARNEKPIHLSLKDIDLNKEINENIEQSRENKQVPLSDSDDGFVGFDTVRQEKSQRTRNVSNRHFAQNQNNRAEQCKTKISMAPKNNFRATSNATKQNFHQKENIFASKYGSTRTKANNNTEHVNAKEINNYPSRFTNLEVKSIDEILADQKKEENAFNREKLKKLQESKALENQKKQSWQQPELKVVSIEQLEEEERHRNRLVNQSKYQKNQASTFWEDVKRHY